MKEQILNASHTTVNSSCDEGHYVKFLLAACQKSQEQGAYAP